MTSSARAVLATVCVLALAGSILFFRPGVHSAVPDQSDVKLELKKGNHVCFVGNTLADRMQHDGWLETLIQARLPQHELVFRNLGFAADELTTRLRSASFGSPDDWLGRCQADVVFAFFGYNESFGGQLGLDKFKKDLEAFIKHTTAAKYNGNAPPKLVLFSPIAHEDLKDPNLPDGKANNERLEMYTTAMAEVAKASNVGFVDLFHPTQAKYQEAKQPLTINGIHLNTAGNRAVAEIIDSALFASQPKPNVDAKQFEKIRQAVLDKNFHWFNRYRTTDGYSIYGGRSGLKFTNGQTNFEVAQREMQILDVLTANRDKRIWAVAQGGDLKIDDSNTPAFIPVVTNKPGAGPNGQHLFLDGDQEAIAKMKVAKNMKVEMFASEKQFPELINPVQMAFDTKGRLWVAAWPTYPHWTPKQPMNDKLLILEDTDGDGRADKCRTFAGDLHNPTGFEFWNGGVLVAMAPDVLFLKDTDGDDQADVRVRVVSGIDSADTHHTSSSFTLDPGGNLYFQEGTFHHTQVETPYGPPERCVNAGVFRYDPRRQKFEVYVSYGFANPHGHVFDRWGQDFIHDGTGAVPYHGTLFSGHLNYPQKHGTPPRVYNQRTRPCPGTEILSSRHFPPEMQGNLLVGNVIGFQGILNYKINDKSSSFEGVEMEPIVSSTDGNFRPADIEVGPDGAIYFTDWHNPIIGHMQHNLRDPSRGKTHGRVYRVTYTGRDLVKPVKIAGEPIDKLLEALKEPDDRVRCRARIELSGRTSSDVVAALKKWIASLDPRDEEYQHHLMEALWVHQHHNAVNVELLKRMLSSPEFRARAAATRVLCYWRDGVPEALALLKKQAADEHPRVRLEAIRAASFFPVPEAVEIPLISAEYPTDVYIDFTRGETMKALDPVVKAAIAKGQTINFTSDVGARYFLKNLSTEEVLKMKRSRAVYLELLFRKGVRDELRREALNGLATDAKKKPIEVLLDAIRGQDELKSAQEESVVFDLVRLLTDRGGDLKDVRADLEKMAVSSKLPVTRQLGFAALIAADGNIDKAWALGTKSVAALGDLVSAMPLVRDPEQRAALYPKVAPLLDKLPDGLGSAEPNKKGTLGRFVRIELEGKRTLTLAEVEVMSAGSNVARRGKASQKSTAFNGDAARAIDGNKSGTYGDNGQTHSEENTSNPWWEVDLGGEAPIDAIIVYNRTEGALGKRLDNFTLKVLDDRKQEVFVQRNNPAPDRQAEFKLAGAGPESIIRRQAMLALTTVRGQEAATFKALAKFVREDSDRLQAIRALQRIPTKDWPAEEARPLLDSITSYVRTLPANERTTPAALDAMQLAYALTPLLPADEGRKARKDLGELGVRVLRLGTLVDQMLYDKERLVVQAGKPVEIVFENTDLMPHNLVLLEPGSLEEVGLAGEALATDPSALARQYVPNSKKVLLASKLLQPRDVQQLSFTAPKKAGVYPYVCTYPGHWRRMFGALYVVDDLEEYLAEPEAYLTKNPLKIADPLLAFNRPRKEWKLDELAGLVEKLEHGRSFANGKQIFSVATCAACHKLNGVGNEFGPDLTKPDPKLTRADILREIVEPSHRINEKFQSFVIETNAGKVHTGLVLDEAGDTIKLIENPLAKAAPIEIKKSDVASRAKAPTSIMPKGLLDKLTQEEILDLVAYVLAKGDAKHMLFHGHHDH